GKARPEDLFAAAGVLRPAVPPVGLPPVVDSGSTPRRARFEASPSPAVRHRRSIAVVAGVADTRAANPRIEGVVGPLDPGLLAHAEFLALWPRPFIRSQQ